MGTTLTTVPSATSDQADVKKLSDATISEYYEEYMEDFLGAVFFSPDNTTIMSQDMILTPAAAITEVSSGATDYIQVDSNEDSDGNQILAVDDICMVVQRERTFGASGTRNNFGGDATPDVELIAITAVGDIETGDSCKLTVTRGYRSTSEDTLVGGDVLIKVGEVGSTFNFIWYDSVNRSLKLTYTDDNGGWSAPTSIEVKGSGGDLSIACPSEKTVEISPVVYEDIRIIPSAFAFPGNNDPTLVGYQPAGAGTTFQLYEYALDDEGFFTIQIPHTYKEGEDIYCHVHWTPGANGAGESGNAVAWKLDYSWANIDGTFPESSTADMTDACNGTDHEHNMTPEATISGSGKTISSMLICRLYRDDVAGDTWSGTGTGNLPLLLEFDIHYPVNTLGSRTRSSK